MRYILEGFISAILLAGLVVGVIMGLIWVVTESMKIPSQEPAAVLTLLGPANEPVRVIKLTHRSQAHGFNQALEVDTDAGEHLVWRGSYRIETATEASKP